MASTWQYDLLRSCGCWRGWHFYTEGFVANRRFRYVLYRCSHGCPDDIPFAEWKAWGEIEKTVDSAGGGA